MIQEQSKNAMREAASMLLLGDAKAQTMSKSALEEELRLLDRACVTDPVRMRLYVALNHMRNTLLTRLTQYLNRRFDLLDGKVRLATELSLPTTDYLPPFSSRKEKRRTMTMSALTHSSLLAAQSALRLEEFIGRTVIEASERERRMRLKDRSTMGKRKIVIDTPGPNDSAVLLAARVEALRREHAKVQEELEERIMTLEEENRLLRDPQSTSKLPSEQILLIQLNDLRNREASWAQNRSLMETEAERLNEELAQVKEQRKTLIADAVRMRSEHTKAVKNLEDQLQLLTKKSEGQVKELIALEHTVSSVVASFRTAAKERDILAESLENEQRSVKTLKDEHENALRSEREVIARKEAALFR